MSGNRYGIGLVPNEMRQRFAIPHLSCAERGATSKGRVVGVVGVVGGRG